MRSIFWLKVQNLCGLRKSRFIHDWSSKVDVFNIHQTAERMDTATFFIDYSGH